MIHRKLSHLFKKNNTQRNRENSNSVLSKVVIPGLNSEAWLELEERSVLADRLGITTYK